MKRPCGSITVLIATRNRSTALDRCLGGLCEQVAPGGVEVDVLVVDNGSTDGTGDVVRSWQDRCGFPLKSLWEETPGRSRALNRGLLEASGDLIFLLDDDARPLSGWMEATWRAFDEGGADVVGGRLLPLPPFEPPDWYEHETMRGMLALLDWGEEPLELHEDFPYGANLSMRRDTARRLGGFDLRLGRTGTSLLAGEDHEFALRVARSGGRVLYWPDSKCEHEVNPQRLRRSYFRRWKLYAGRSSYHFTAADAVKRVGPFPRYVVGAALRAKLAWWWAVLRFDGRDAFAAELRLRGLLGCLYEAGIGRHQTGVVPQLLERPPELVTAVIPAFNAADTIEESIRSVLDATRVPDEIIVVDDHSEDDTARVSGQIDPRVRVLSAAGSGPSAARNTGIRAANGDWVAFLDADDVWTPGKLARQLDAVRAHPEVAFVSSRITFFDESGEEWPAKRRFPPDGLPGDFLEAVLRENYLYTQTVMARREALLEVGGFDEERDRSEDLDLWTRVLARYRGMFVDHVGARKRVRPGSLSSDFEGMFRADKEIVGARLDECDWDDERKRKVSHAAATRIHVDRAHQRFEANDLEGARADFLANVRQRPLAMRSWYFLALIALPGGMRNHARSMGSRVRRLMGA